MLSDLTDLYLSNIKKYREPNYGQYLIEWLNTDEVRNMLKIPQYK